MSYGVWRNRGKGWRSLEIDSPYNEQKSSDLAFDRFENQAERDGIETFGIDRGEHTVVIAARDKSAFLTSIAKLELHPPFVTERQARSIARHFNACPDRFKLLRPLLLLDH